MNHDGKHKRIGLLLAILGVLAGASSALWAADNRLQERARLEVRVWRLDYNVSSHPGLDWQVFGECSQSPEPVAAPVADATARQPEKRNVNRTPGGLLRHSFAMRRPGEELLPNSQIARRIELFTGVLVEGLSLPSSGEGGAGRGMTVKQELEEVQLIDTDMNVFKAQLIYDSLFPAPLVSRPAAPLPSRQDLSIVIDALKAQHRGTAELEGVLNRVTGRVRDQDSDVVDDRNEDRMRTRFTGDDASGHLIVTSPVSETQGTDVPAAAPVARAVDRYQSVDVNVGKSSIPRGDRFRRFGPVDFALLNVKMGQIGRLKVLSDRPFNLVSGRPLSLAAGPTIPFLRYRPPADRDDAKPASTKIGATLNVVPSRLGEDAWQMAIITEFVDFIDYPQITKTYLEFSSALKPGDTLIFKKLEPNEISDDTMIHAEVASAAETFIFLTLKEN